MKLKLIIGFVFVCLFFLDFCDAKDIVAKGRGFVLTKRDLKVLGKYIRGPFIPRGNSLIKYALRIKLFAKEALAKGLKVDKNADFKDEWEQDIALYRLYKKELVKECKPSEEAVISYYYAHWRKFIERPKSVCVTSKNYKLKPLDEVKGFIKKKIKRFKVKVELQKKFEELIKKYNVIICDGEKCA